MRPFGGRLGEHFIILSPGSGPAGWLAGWLVGWLTGCDGLTVAVGSARYDLPVVNTGRLWEAQLLIVLILRTNLQRADSIAALDRKSR